MKESMHDTRSVPWSILLQFGLLHRLLSSLSARERQKKELCLAAGVQPKTSAHGWALAQSHGCSLQAEAVANWWPQHLQSRTASGTIPAGRTLGVRAPSTTNYHPAENTAGLFSFLQLYVHVRQCVSCSGARGRPYCHFFLSSALMVPRSDSVVLFPQNRGIFHLWPN